jgi:hypothetical protein
VCPWFLERSVTAKIRVVTAIVSAQTRTGNDFRCISYRRRFF